MGQASSWVASHDQDSRATMDSSTQPSLESLIAEAAAYGEEDDENQAKGEKALECPCIAGLRNGPCGAQFSDAFVCFLKSTNVEKGSDCVDPFVALQKCIKANPEAFSKEDILDEGDINNNQEKPTVVRPPIWSQESTNPKRST